MRSSQSLHVRITESVEELAGLLSRLETEVPEKKRQPYGGYGSGQGGHSPLAAWNAPAAMLVMDVHAGARDLETDLKHRLTGRLRSRGGSSGNTLKCLAGIPSLCAGVDYHDAATALKKLEIWIYRARLVLGDADPVSRLPRLPGQAEPSCPYCRGATLRFRQATGVVRCIRPGCRDGNGQAPAARIELGDFSGTPIVAWADGSTGVGGLEARTGLRGLVRGSAIRKTGFRLLNPHCTIFVIFRSRERATYETSVAL